MAVTLAVPYQVLREMKRRWDDSADELDGSWRRLSKVSTKGFSPEVAAAVDAFTDPWVEEIKACAETAQGYSDEIVFFRNILVLTDEAHAQRIRAALPWVHRDAEIGS